jgi:hypothetical protein
MSKLISSPFLFDSSEVRDACVAALGLEALANSEIVEVDNANLTLTPDNHKNKLILFGVASPAVGSIQIGLESVAAWDERSKITIIKTGTASTSFSVANGVTINSPESLEIRKQYSVVQLIRVAEDVWTVTGDLRGLDEYAIQLEVPAVNGSLNYYDGNATLVASSTLPLTNISAIGGKIAISENNLITIPYDFAGAPVEIQFDEITPVKYDFTSNLSLQINSSHDALDVTGMNMILGVGPFKLGEAKFFTYSIIVTESVPTPGTVDVRFENNGVFIAEYLAVPNDSSFGFKYFESSNTLEFTLNQAGDTEITDSVFVESEPWPLYTRIIFNGIAADASFKVNYNAAKNGMGRYIPARLSTAQGKFELNGNLITPI